MNQPHYLWVRLRRPSSTSFKPNLIHWNPFFNPNKNNPFRSADLPFRLFLSCEDSGDGAQAAVEETTRGEGVDGGPLTMEEERQRHQRSYRCIAMSGWLVFFGNGENIVDKTYKTVTWDVFFNSVGSLIKKWYNSDTFLEMQWYMIHVINNVMLFCILCQGHPMFDCQDLSYNSHGNATHPGSRFPNAQSWI